MPRLPRSTKRPTRTPLAGGGVDDAILYGRVSTDDQEKAGTIDAQKTFLREYAHLYKLNVLGEFWDDGVSGTIPLPDRPAGARLLETAAAHPGAVVVVYRLDRLGRKLRVILDAHEALKEMGVSVRSGTEPFDSSTPFGTFMLQFTASMAELDRSSTLEKLTRGRDRVAGSGKWTGGPIPYGLDVDADGHLVPSLRPVGDRTEADIAREVIQNVADGSSCVREAERLKALNVPSFKRWAPNPKKKRPTGTQVAEGARVASGAWHANRVLYMVRNETYSGAGVVRSQYGDVVRPVKTPLVDRATQQRALAQLSRNRIMATRNAKRIYLLRGLVKCTCGAGYCGAGGGPSKGESSRWYRCVAAVKRRRDGSRCGGKAVRADGLEALVWADCKAWADDPGQALEDARAQLADRLERAPAIDAERQRLQRALLEKDAERQRVVAGLRSGVLRLAEAEREMADIEQQAALLRSQEAGLRAQQDLAAAFEARCAGAAETLARVRGRVAAIEAGLASDDLGRAVAARAEQRGVIEDLVAGIVMRTELEGGRKRAVAEITYVFGAPNVVEPSSAVLTEDYYTISLRREVALAGAWRGA